MHQIFIFSGSNHYAIFEEKKRWVKSFIDKHGEENYLRLESKGLTVRSLIDEASVAPFIAQNRLIIVDGPLKCEKPEADQLLKQIHPGVVLLFMVSLGSDRKEKLPADMKEIAKIADHRKFYPLSRQALARWMDDECKKHGSSLSVGAKELLMEIAGSDQGMLAQEIGKLSIYACGKPITEKFVEDLAVTSGEREAWRVIDLLAGGKPEEGMQYAQWLLERGDDPNGLWSRILWAVSRLALVWAAADRGLTNFQKIANETGVSPYTAKSLLPCAKRMSRKKLGEVVSFFADMDRDLKTGALRSTVENQEEIKAVIDRSMMEFAR